MKKPTETDVVVVGSGAGGAPVALALAQAGVRVTILDKGPYYTVKDFTHDEVAICRRNFFIPYVSDDPHTIRQGGAVVGTRTRQGWISLNVGGGTVHMSGFTYRLHDEDFDLRTRTGGIAGANLADWPIRLADLLPFYDLAEVLVGVSGEAGRNPFEVHPRPYPLPALVEHPAAQLIDEAAQRMGLHSFPTARMITSQPYGVRPPCNYCGLCGEYGCENGSKSSVYATLLPQAVATGRCEIRPQSFVTRVLVDEQDRAKGVEYIDSEGETQAVLARTVVLAATSIESARLLLLSANSRFPNGLANRSGLVGKNLCFSTFAKSTAILDRHAVIAKVGATNADLPFLQRSVQDDYWLGQRHPTFPKGGTYNFLFHHPSPINAGVRLVEDSGYELWGQALKERMATYFHDELWAECEIFGEFLPTDKTFVDLDPEVKDRWGMPVARITVDHHPADVETSRFLLERTVAIFEHVTPKPKEIRRPAVGDTTFHLQHGTCRFGKDREHSVLDPNCQSHDVKGLYVTDASFMPTSSGVPTTLTVVANSLRVAHAILQGSR